MVRNKPKFTQIIDAAVEVIAENGYHHSQISRIASKAGVADGTIYLYFKNKEDILISVFQEKMGQFIEKIESAIQKEENAGDKLLCLIRMHFRQLAENHDLAVVTQLELRQSKVTLRAKINQVLKPYLNIIDTIIYKGIEEGVFREALNIHLVRQMIFGTMDETVTNWIMQGATYNLSRQAKDVHILLTEGIACK